MLLCLNGRKSLQLYSYIKWKTFSENVQQTYTVYGMLFGCPQVHLKILEYGESFFSCNLFQKVKLSYILDSLHVK